MLRPSHGERGGGAGEPGRALAGAALLAVQAAVLRAGCTLCLASALLSIGAAVAVAEGGEVQAAFRTARAGRRRRAASWR
jgi:hypothetical protein